VPGNAKKKKERFREKRSSSFDKWEKETLYPALTGASARGGEANGLCVKGGPAPAGELGGGQGGRGGDGAEKKKGVRREKRSREGGVMPPYLKGL